MDSTDSTMFEYPLLSGVAYAERVVHSERDNFEKRCRWKIRDMTFDNRPVQEEYAPLVCYYQEDITHVNSLDMLALKRDREIVLKARAVGKALISDPFRLLRSKRIGVILTYPVYISKLSPSMGVEERIRATAGYIGGILQFESLVENVLRQLGNETVLVTVYDIANCSHALMMYGHKNVESDWSMTHESKLELGDPSRKHLMICRYRDAASLSWNAVLVAVLIITISSLAPAAAIHIVKLRQASLRIRGLEVQLQDANAANSQLRAEASEIKQPAYIIIQTLAMLLDTNLSSIQRGYIQIAQACGRRQIALVDKAIESPNLPVTTHTI
ncbi:CHASE domain-containing protein [Psidium guajava]|nr:CHASE domain-containing protein [Psidium guajava]